MKSEDFTMSDIRDASLAPTGRDKIAWVADYMPILNRIKAEFEKTQPFAGLTIAMSSTWRPRRPTLPRRFAPAVPAWS